MEKFYLVTANPAKVQAYNSSFKIGFDIEILNKDYPQDKSIGTTSLIGKIAYRTGV